MAVLFVSHSSKDDGMAASLETWLQDRGFTDVFVDHNKIVGGEKWAQALRDAAGTCRVVICVVTEHWLQSDECFSEFRAAWYMGKRIIPLLALVAGKVFHGERLSKVLAEDQGLDTISCVTADGRLDLRRDTQVERRLEMGLRAAGALAKVGLDPEAFAIDRKLRSMPFPGLASFGDNDADAALFYGRSREIAETLEELRQIRAIGDKRAFVILGASGAGKSSLLKAGIIPRLRREAPAWLPLRAFRPGANPLLNFAEALANSLADFGKVEAPGTIRDRLLDVWSKAERVNNKLTGAGQSELIAALELEGRKLRDAANRAGATILLSVDQAEETARADGDGSDALADYLHAALSSASAGWQLAFTIRSDRFIEFQRHRRFQDFEGRAYDLRSIPVFRFDSVVESPAKRYGVTVEDALVYSLIDDAPKEDALPLLAFALQRLWQQYAASGTLTKNNYEKVRGLRGLIEDAAERALRGLAPNEDVALPAGPPPKHRIDLAASTFVPALAQIDEQGATVRCVASWNSFNDEQQDLLFRFDEWRLVLRKGTEFDGGTVEVAHEALFREWTRLKGWFEPERARLEALRVLQIDALTWDRNDRNVAYLNHRDRRLAEATALSSIDTYCKRLGSSEFAYLSACREAERLAQQRRKRLQASFGVLLAGIIAVIVGWTEQEYIGEQIYWYWTLRPYANREIWPYVKPVEFERALIPEASFRECAKDCPEMIVIEPGNFFMGAKTTERYYAPQEGPLHSVTIAKSFAVSKYVVTFADWDACVSVNWCRKVEDASFGDDGKRPVVKVSWEDAKHYVAWLSKLTGKPYRLLTEAEWEYAARARSKTAYYWGGDVGIDNANCLGCNKQVYNKTLPVGSFKANDFGLYDMAGNVWQWVEDCFHENYEGAPADGSAWTTGDCGWRVARGGAANFYPPNVRSAYRGMNSPSTRLPHLGFRIARTLAH